MIPFFHEVSEGVRTKNVTSDRTLLVMPAPKSSSGAPRVTQRACCRAALYNPGTGTRIYQNDQKLPAHSKGSPIIDNPTDTTCGSPVKSFKLTSISPSPRNLSKSFLPLEDEFPFNS